MKRRIIGNVSSICVLILMMTLLLALFSSPAYALCAYPQEEGVWVNFANQPERINSVKIEKECNDVILVPDGGTPIPPSGPQYWLHIWGKSPIDGKIMDWGKVGGDWLESSSSIFATFNLGDTSTSVWLRPSTEYYKDVNGVWTSTNRLYVTAKTINRRTQKVDETHEVFVRQVVRGLNEDGGVGFSAIWTKATDDRPAVWGWARKDFDKKAAEMKSQGYKLIKINAYVPPGATDAAWNGIWLKTNEDRPYVYGWARKDFDKKVAEMQANGYKLIEINAYVPPGATDAAWNGIWLKTNEDRPYVYGWARKDFDQKAAEMEARGYQLVEINAYVPPGATDAAWNGIWLKTNVYSAVWGLARKDFNMKAAEMQALGYQFTSLNAFVLENTERYNAVWKKPCQGLGRLCFQINRPAVWDWARKDFDNKAAEMQGYTLMSLNAFGN